MYRLRELIQNLKSKLTTFASNNVKYIWSIGITFSSFLLLELVSLDEYLIKDYPYLGESILFSSIFLATYFLGTPIVKYISSWIERLVSTVITKALYEFWQSQSLRFYDVLKRNQKDGTLMASDNIEDTYQNLVTTTAPIVLDTSAIIDGRIVGLLKLNYIDSNIIVTQDVLNELKRMADKSNDLKREKGRRGLDILNEIKKIVGRKRFKIVEVNLKVENVDDSLVQFSKQIKAKIATVDFNLNKTAKVNGVKVLNINELVNEIKLNLLPGDVISIKLVQEGKEDGQTVGYLNDGTMIVVKESVQYLGEDKNIIIEKVLQTTAGRMVFGVVI